MTNPYPMQTKTYVDYGVENGFMIMVASNAAWIGKVKCADNENTQTS